jgi:hypothetical protein
VAGRALTREKSPANACFGDSTLEEQRQQKSNNAPNPGPCCTTAESARCPTPASRDGAKSPPTSDKQAPAGQPGSVVLVVVCEFRCRRRAPWAVAHFLRRIKRKILDFNSAAAGFLPNRNTAIMGAGRRKRSFLPLILGFLKSVARSRANKGRRRAIVPLTQRIIYSMLPLHVLVALALEEAGELVHAASYVPL